MAASESARFSNTAQTRLLFFKFPEELPHRVSTFEIYHITFLGFFFEIYHIIFLDFY